MNVGYCKLGRAMPLPQGRWGVVGGDMEPPRLLDELARRHPEDRFIITSMCRDDPQDAGLPPNVINSWTPERLEWLKQNTGNANRLPNRYEETQRRSDLYDRLMFPVYDKLDAIIVWAGQHGTSNTRIPVVSDRGGAPDGLTTPQDSFVHYAGSILRGINRWRDVNPLEREEVWLIADARNYLKCRDLKWPIRHPVLGQFAFSRQEQHERYGDKSEPAQYGFNSDVGWKTDHTWLATHRYEYAQLEVCGITPEHVDVHYEENWHGRGHFGLFINEARSYVSKGRRPIVKAWVLPLEPVFIHGSWPDGHEESLGRRISPVPWDQYFPLLRSVRCTFTTPSSGSGYATTKPWEAFAVGTVCFFHPQYDTQDNILAGAPPALREWLRVSTAAELRKRVIHLNTNETAWLWLVREQRKLYDRAMAERQWVRRIEGRIW